MSKSSLPIVLSAMYLLFISCGKNNARKPTMTPNVGLEGIPVPENLPILGTWVSCITLADLSNAYGSRVELTFLQNGKASRQITSYTDLNCQTEFTEADKSAALADFERVVKEAGFPNLSEEEKQKYYHSFDRSLLDGTYSATMPDESGIGSLDAQISSGQKAIRRYDSYKIADGQLVITNSEECEEDCEGIAGSSAESRNRDFSDVIAFDPVEKNKR